jgi:hypothetical protein
MRRHRPEPGHRRTTRARLEQRHRAGDLPASGVSNLMAQRLVEGLGGDPSVGQGDGKGAIIRSHFDAIEVGLNDAPEADPMALNLVMTTGARVHARGGLRVDRISVGDGQRQGGWSGRCGAGP